MDTAQSDRIDILEADIQSLEIQVAELQLLVSKLVKDVMVLESGSSDVSTTH